MFVLGFAFTILVASFLVVLYSWVTDRRHHDERKKEGYYRMFLYCITACIAVCFLFVDVIAYAGIGKMNWSEFQGYLTNILTQTVLIAWAWKSLKAYEETPRKDTKKQNTKK
ncbi:MULTISPECIES: hypothetical protein [Lacticaseibacillus]|uniref:hypothetical protein n=1 Tax=Lacticaseibacillus TaxID=2759736 RepID=UPI00063DAB14|nr:MULTISPECIES: hypothetical protein [Lacticaseibacillus]KLI76781.1 hypothetical protein AAW28_01815 [Lacticaseibacillus casei]